MVYPHPFPWGGGLLTPKTQKNKEDFFFTPPSFWHSKVTFMCIGLNNNFKCFWNGLHILLFLITESAPKLIQSVRPNVHLCVVMFYVSPSLRTGPRELDTSSWGVYRKNCTTKNFFFFFTIIGFLIVWCFGSSRTIVSCHNI